MSAAAVIDSLEFARASEQLRGSLDVTGLKRLDDVLFDTQGKLEYALLGSRDERNRPQLEVTVRGALHLQCQRCLGLLEYDVDVANRLLVTPRGAQHDDELDDPEGPDRIEAEPELDVAGLIEDEVLLSLPLAPRHPEGTCTSALAREGASDGTQKAFARLAALKDSRNTR
jgi:uncharacterized protein